MQKHKKIHGRDRHLLKYLMTYSTNFKNTINMIGTQYESFRDNLTKNKKSLNIQQGISN